MAASNVCIRRRRLGESATTLQVVLEHDTCTAAVEAAGTRRAYFLALQDRSRAHMNTPSCTNTDSNSTLLGRTRRNRADQLIAMIRGRTATAVCTDSQPSPRPSGDQEPSEAVTRTDTRPTHHQVAPRNWETTEFASYPFFASLCALFMTMPTDTTSPAQRLTARGYACKLKPPTRGRLDLSISVRGWRWVGGTL